MCTLIWLDWSAFCALSFRAKTIRSRCAQWRLFRFYRKTTRKMRANENNPMKWNDFFTISPRYCNAFWARLHRIIGLEMKKVPFVCYVTEIAAANARITIIKQWERNKARGHYKFIGWFCMLYKVNDIICTWCITATQYGCYLCHSLLYIGCE